jgi:hypothetical protein
MTPQQQACAIAQEFLEGKRSLVETCRSIQVPLDALGLRKEEAFTAFVGIDSEADAFPLGPERQRWNRDVLAKKDEEFAEFDRFYRPQVELACRSLLLRLSACESG